MYVFLKHYLLITSFIQPSASSTAVQLQREFVPILNLFSVLYQDKEPLPPPDPTQLGAVLETAMASIWVVYQSRVCTVIIYIIYILYYIYIIYI